MYLTHVHNGLDVHYFIFYIVREPAGFFFLSFCPYNLLVLLGDYQFSTKTTNMMTYLLKVEIFIDQLYRIVMVHIQLFVRSVFDIIQMVYAGNYKLQVNMDGVQCETYLIPMLEDVLKLTTVLNRLFQLHTLSFKSLSWNIDRFLLH